MSRTQTTTMPYAQPSQRYCQDCQYCDDCDPTRDRPADVPRICNDHRRRMRFIEGDQITAANHRCSEGAPPGTRPSSAQQQGYPQAASDVQSPQGQVVRYPQGYNPGPGYTYGNNPAGQYPNSQYGGHSQPRTYRSSQHDDYNNADKRPQFDGVTASGNARTHVGSNVRTGQECPDGAIFRDMKFSDNTVSHVGNNIGYDDLESERLARLPYLPTNNGGFENSESGNGH